VLGCLILAGLLAYTGFGGVSALLAAAIRQPELQLVLAAMAVLFLLTGLPAILFYTLWLKRKRDHARRLKAWRWQQVMKRFEVDYGNAYTGPPQDWITSLSWADFERLAAEVFTNLGYQAQSVGQSGDRGIDVRLVNPMGNLEVVQCKQWGNAVGEPEIRNLYGAMMHARAQRAYLFAPQGFTARARDFAQGKPIVLCDLSTICRLIEYGDGPPAAAAMEGTTGSTSVAVASHN
jgi:restriction system protein